MQERLAQRLLAKVLNWQEEEVRKELAPLLVLAEAKYDRYQQYSPGMRFIESLAVWLEQFPTLLRKQAFELIRDNLIFVSAEEMFHIVQMAFPDHIRPLLMQVAADRLHVPHYRVAAVATSAEYRTLLAKTLYVGLSDGSQIGLLRRLNPGVIRHEHTLISYDTPDTQKTGDMLQKHLKPALEEIAGNIVTEGLRFEVLVLVDDFAASGISFFRQEEGNTYKGKLAKILAQIKANRYNGLLSEDELHICVLFYVATPSAIDRLKNEGQAYLDIHLPEVHLHVMAVQRLEDDVMILPPDGDDLNELLRLAITGAEDIIIDEHWRKGKHERPYLGYNECALPVVLSHNTPNNSLPILWFTGRQDQKAIFPRTTRHGKQ